MADAWKTNSDLAKALDRHVSEGLKRVEILDFMIKYFPSYRWSIRTLDRRMRYFGIYYVEHELDPSSVANAVLKELDGPGQLLGYRAMQKKLRLIHGLKVSRADVHAIMKAADRDGLEGRAPCFKKKKKGCFTSPGTNFVHSLDGHDKLMGYQNSTFPIAVYGCMDTCSRKLLWVKVSHSNSNPRLIGRFYLEYLFEKNIMARYLRVDRGTETTTMAAMHAFLRQHDEADDAVDTVIYGPSTSNQIERWWRELHERLEKFFKTQLKFLLDHKIYDPQNHIHRELMAYIMVPVMQENIDQFVSAVWNPHRIRPQKDSRLPCGVPNHIYDFPESYGLEELGVPVDAHSLQEVATSSGILDVDDDPVSHATREACEKILPDPHKIDSAKCAEAFLNLLRDIGTDAT